MRILLVEDEDRVASFVEKGLTAEGHGVDRVPTAARALEYAFSREYDLVLLDLLLPDANGRSVLERIRAEDPDLPIVIVSALGDTDEKVELLDAGANDYIVKPFDFAELAARVRANTRPASGATRVLEVGDLRLDTVTRKATRGDVTADLPSREFALLEYLMRHPGQILSRQQILDAVWGFDFDSGSNVVDVYVGYLRRKLDPADGPSAIQTVRGAGYRVGT
jgi:DNA-binding response OmpR family regulator